MPAEMPLHEIDLPAHFNEIEIKPISDCHIGDPRFDRELLESEIEWAKQADNRYILLNGDIMNTATTKSVSNTYEATMTPHEELNTARELFVPAKDSTLALTTGNHERRIKREDGFDLSAELAKSLDAIYRPEGLMIKIRFGQRKSNQKKQVYNIYMSHGFTGSRTSGGKANRLEKKRTIVVADVYIQSHTHQKIVFNKDIFIADNRNNKMTRKHQTFVNTGAYLSYGGYGEQKEYDPADKGTVVIKLDGAKKNIQVIS